VPDAHFVASADDTTVALWTEAALGRGVLEPAAVDAALRAQGDLLIAWTRLATTAFGARLHEDLRVRLFPRFTAKALWPGAELVALGDPVVGILLVADGAVEIDGNGSALEPGSFVFPEATLLAGRAPATARAAAGGAVVLAADRRTTQELWATEPLLLELLSAG